MKRSIKKATPQVKGAGTGLHMLSRGFRGIKKGEYKRRINRFSGWHPRKLEIMA